MSAAVAVRERPLLMSGPMVRAILEGRKTQTRRVVTKENSEFGAWGAQLWKIADLSKAWVDGKGSGSEYLHVPVDDARCVGVFAGMDGIVDRLRCRMAPYDAYEQTPDPETGYVPPASRLWVREAWGRFNGCGTLTFHADEMHPMGAPERWRPSIHMRRADSRITLEITDVRVQRVQDISEADAEAEGVETDVLDQALFARKYDTADEWFQMWSEDMSNYVDLEEIHRASYRTLWDSLNAKRGYSWESNPWIWAISFRRASPAGGETE